MLRGSTGHSSSVSRNKGQKIGLDPVLNADQQEERDIMALSSSMLGRPIWYELMTADTAAAETFYKNVVGWTAAPFGASPQPYTIFKRSGDAGVAGMMKMPDGMNVPPFWAMYVGVPDFAAAVAHIKRAGGSELS